MSSAGRKFGRGKVQTVSVKRGSAREKKLLNIANEAEFVIAPFDEEIMQHLRTIKRRLDDVFPQTLAKWEEGFRKDMSAEREIAWWLVLSEKYEQATSGKTLNQAEKMNIYRRLFNGEDVH